MKQYHPNAKLLLRLIPPIVPSEYLVFFGDKFGCSSENVLRLLRLAKKLELDVIGVNFHVGTGTSDPIPFAASIDLARGIFDTATAEGFKFHLLDIGGGFSGDSSGFEKMCPVINKALDLHFPESTNVRIIAEPGRYYVTSAFTIVTNVIGVRMVGVPEPIEESNGCSADHHQSDDDDTAKPMHSYMYYINDGRFGSMYCAAHIEQYTPTTIDPHRSINAVKYKSIIWGPTCTSMDRISKTTDLLPKLDCGDWIVFNDVGAYSVALVGDFNGMERSKCYYYMQEKNWLNFSRMERTLTRPNGEGDLKKTSTAE